MSVHVLRCPNCGADLEVTDGSATIRCRYCKAHCRVEGVGAGAKLTAEQEAAWNGLIEEVKKIDLDALENDLENLNQIYEEKKTRDLWEALADNALGNEAELDALAQRWVAEGTGRKFLANMGKIASGDSVEHKAIRRVVDRLAAKVALLLTAQAEEAAAKGAALAAAKENLDAARERVEKSRRDLALVQEAERRGAEARKRLAELNSPAELEKVRAARELIARAEAEQEAAALSRIRIVVGQQEADRNAALALRSQYRMSRVWAIVAFPVVMGCVGAAGFGLLAWSPADWVKTLGQWLFLGSPLVALTWSSMTWSRGTDAGRKFNELALLVGLPLVAAKPKSPHEDIVGWNAEMAGGCGCMALIVLAVGLWAVGHFGWYATNTPPANQPDNSGPSGNSPSNAPSPAINSESEPTGNSAAPSNSPAGNTAPPANGESAPANNALRSD